MRKIAILAAVLLVLAVAAFGFGCSSAEEIRQTADDIQAAAEDITEKASEIQGGVGEIAEQAGKLQEGIEQFQDATGSMHGDIEIEPDETPAVAEAPPAEPGMKIITVWLRDGVLNATINGKALEPGVDNKVEIMTDHPLVAEFDYTDSFGREAHATVDLDGYYDYFMLEELGGYSQTIHPDEYEEVKVTGIR